MVDYCKIAEKGDFERLKQLIENGEVNLNVQYSHVNNNFLLYIFK